jgi:hypothetical protein
MAVYYLVLYFFMKNEWKVIIIALFPVHFTSTRIITCSHISPYFVTHFITYGPWLWLWCPQSHKAFKAPKNAGTHGIPTFFIKVRSHVSVSSLSSCFLLSATGATFLSLYLKGTTFFSVTDVFRYWMVITKVLVRHSRPLAFSKDS